MWIFGMYRRHFDVIWWGLSRKPHQLPCWNQQKRGSGEFYSGIWWDLRLKPHQMPQNWLISTTDVYGFGLQLGYSHTAGTLRIIRRTAAPTKRFESCRAKNSSACGHPNYRLYLCLMLSKFDSSSSQHGYIQALKVLQPEYCNEENRKSTSS